MMIHKHNGYGPDGLRRLFKGGGGGSTKYDNLEELYKEQTESARLLREQAEANLPGAVKSYVDETKQVLDPGYAETQAARAATDMGTANAQERAATTRNLMSMGVNPNDSRFAGSLRTTELNNAARLAAGKNAARQQADNYQLNVAKDAVGTFTGQSNQAATQMGNAASGLGSVYNAQANQQANSAAMTQNAIGSAVGAGIAGYGIYNQKKDGGRICLPRGLRVERHMMGGGAGSQNQGFFQMQAIAPPPPTAQAPQGNPVGAAIGTANQINGLYKAGSKLAGKSATDAGAQKAGEVAAQKAGEVAAQKAGEAVAEKAVEAGAQKAVETAATTAATNAAVPGGASALAGGAGAALGAASAALPWVGAAYGVGKLLELWNSGGQVGTQMSDEEADAKYSEAWNSGDVQDIRQGGKVPGEWQGNTDNVPALLTEDEHVVNAEAAAMIGHDKLEALNKQGLSMRAKGYTPGRIRAAGIKGAK
jgi:hypothetical protein